MNNKEVSNDYPKIGQKIRVRLNDKTVLYLKPGSDIEEIKAKYLRYLDKGVFERVNSSVNYAPDKRGGANKIKS